LNQAAFMLPRSMIPFLMLAPGGAGYCSKVTPLDCSRATVDLLGRSCRLGAPQIDEDSSHSSMIVGC
jgi:hypothetical protein